MGDSQQPSHEEIMAGLSFVAKAHMDYSAIFKHQAFGDVLRNPEFVGVDAMEATIRDKMDTVREIPVYAHTPEGTQILLEDWKAIQSGQSGKVHAIPSFQYVPVQDKDIAVPLWRECKARNLWPVGSHHGQGTGRTSGHVLIANPEYKLTLLEEYKEDVMLGVRWWNSFDTGTSFGADVFGIRTVCANYGAYGKVLGEFRFRHTNKAHDSNWVQAQYEALVKNALTKSSVLRGKVEQAVSIVIPNRDVEDLLWGVRFPILGISELAGKGLQAYAVDWEKYPHSDKATSLWTIYNAATAYITYRPNGAKYQKATWEHSTNALKLLTQAHDGIIARGREARESHEKAKEKQKVKAPVPIPMENIQVVNL